MGVSIAAARTSIAVGGVAVDRIWVGVAKDAHRRSEGTATRLQRVGTTHTTVSEVRGQRGSARRGGDKQVGPSTGGQPRETRRPHVAPGGGGLCAMQAAHAFVAPRAMTVLDRAIAERASGANTKRGARCAVRLGGRYKQNGTGAVETTCRAHGVNAAAAAARHVVPLPPRRRPHLLRPRARPFNGSEFLARRTATITSRAALPHACRRRPPNPWLLRVLALPKLCAGLRARPLLWANLLSLQGSRRRAAVATARRGHAAHPHRLLSGLPSGRLLRLHLVRRGQGRANPLARACAHARLRGWARSNPHRAYHPLL